VKISVMKVFNRIKNKLRLSFLALVLLAAIGGLVSFFYLNRVFEYQKSKDSFNEIVYLFSEALRNQNDFLLYDRKKVGFLENRDAESLSSHEKNISKIFEILNEIENSQLATDLNINANLVTLKLELEGLRALFDDLVDAYHTRGFKDHGLEGNMRAYVHSLQDRDSPQEQVYAFSLRRHEKDFIIRKDEKYVDRIKNTSQEFIDYLKAGNEPQHTPEYVARAVKDIQAYVTQFEKIVDIERKIGLTNDAGIVGELNLAIKNVQPRISAIQNTINTGADKLINQSKLIFISSLGILLVIGFAFSAFFSSTISKPIVLLEGITKDVLEGNDDVEDRLRSVKLKDEIGSLFQNFGLMLKSIKDNLSVISLKNEELEKTAKEEEKRAWANEGLAQFADIIKNNSANIKDLSFEIISNLVKYTHSNQGGIFIINENENEPEMELVATYAFNRKKHVKKSIIKGEGLIGAAWQEMDTIFLTEVPQDYINITSGLGEANPKSILIVPLKTDDNIVGVLEMASFKPYEPHEIHFVETLSERLASGIQSVRLQQRTNELLEDAQQMAEELKANEEELRQNMEELQATQEEMARNQEETNQKLVDANRTLNIYEQVVQSIYKGIIITSSGLQILKVNQYVLSLTSYMEEDFQHRDLHDLIDGDISGSFEGIMDGSQKPGAFAYDTSMNLLDKLGRKIVIGMMASKVKIGAEEYYVFLFNKEDLSKAGKLVNRLLRTKQLMAN
jgi:PAS domain-containing protein